MEEVLRLRIRELEAEIEFLRGQRAEAQARYQAYREWSERTILGLVDSFRTEVQHLGEMITAFGVSVAQWGQSSIGRIQEELDREFDSVHRLEGVVSRIIRGTRVPRYEAPVVLAAASPAAPAAVPAPIATVAPVAPILPPVVDIHPIPAPPAERQMMGVTFFSGVPTGDEPQRGEGPSGVRAGRPPVYPRVRLTARKSTIRPPPPTVISEPVREVRDPPAREIHGTMDGVLGRLSSSGGNADLGDSSSSSEGESEEDS